MRTPTVGILRNKTTPTARKRAPHLPISSHLWPPHTHTHTHARPSNPPCTLRYDTAVAAAVVVASGGGGDVRTGMRTSSAKRGCGASERKSRVRTSRAMYTAASSHCANVWTNATSMRAPVGVTSSSSTRAEVKRFFTGLNLHRRTVLCGRGSCARDAKRRGEGQAGEHSRQQTSWVHNVERRTSNDNLNDLRAKFLGART
jgi:hypothetical protein